MPETHPSRDQLERFMSGGLSPSEACRIVGHLLADCVRCKKVTDAIWQSMEDGLAASRREPSAAEMPRTSAYGKILDRAMAVAGRQAIELAREREEAPLLLADLISHPQARRLTLVHNARSFQTWSLCELLIEASFDCRFDEIKAGVELAELAVAAAERLDPRIYGERHAKDLQLRAWTYLGNARRVASDLRGAGEAFDQALRCQEQGTGDPLDEALLSRFRAHLMRAWRRFAEAFALYDRAIALYRQCGAAELLARSLTDHGLARLYAGDPEQAIPPLDEALRLLEGGGDCRMLAAVRHNLALCLSDTGSHQQALQLLRQARPVYRERGDRISLIRARWLEGRILKGLGQERHAEEALREARDAMVQEDIAYDAALASLDLAGIYAAQGRARELRELTAEMIPIFQSQQVHREALAALILFRQAVESEQISLALIHQITTFLQAARRDPSLRFRVPA